MSYSYDVKEELSNFKNMKNTELLEAEFLGYILTGNAVLNGEKICYITENEYNIERFFKILFNLKIEYEPNKNGKLFEAIIDSKAVSERFIKFSNVTDDNIKRTIIKGAFLGSGSITDPEKGYHLEISFGDEKNAEYVLNLSRTYGVNFKIIKVNKCDNSLYGEKNSEFSHPKKDKFIIYIKDGEQISNFLACIGANKAVLKFEDIRIFKEMKNNVNRIVNCESANLNKTIDAGIMQIEDIKLIQKRKQFEELSEELKEVANIRLENPEASLKEIGEMLVEPISKSGVNHRFKKIHEIAEELRK